MTITSILLLRSRPSKVVIHLTNNSLAIGRCRHEVWLSFDADRSVTVGTIALSNIHLPDILPVVVVITGVVRVSVRVMVNVGRRTLTRESLIRTVSSKGAVEPVTVQLAVARSSGRRILWSAVA